MRHATFIELELVRVEAGYFMMGSAESDKAALDDEKPQRSLYLPEYWIGRWTVTNKEYALFMRANPGLEKPVAWESTGYPVGKGQHPVRGVSWKDAVDYCRWHSNLTRERYTLPSEVEWEKAARGTDGRIYPWGNTWDASRCNSAEAGIRDTMEVGKYSPDGDSPYGCADMAGNVWEWTRSLYKDYPYHPDDGREDITVNGPRVLRGGAFYRYRWFVRCAFRLWDFPSFRFDDFGFRVVLLPDTSRL